MRIAVIGAGVSGLAAANILKRCGHDVTVYDAASQIGGLWATAYAGVRLQNVAAQYRLNGVDYATRHGREDHPSAAEVMAHLERAVRECGLRVLLNRRVASMQLTDARDAWVLHIEHADATADETETFDKVVIAAGQHSEVRAPTDDTFPGLSRFGGKVALARELEDGALDKYAGQRVVVVGFGRTGTDVATALADGGAASSVDHVFRTAHWMVPQFLMGTHFTHILFARHASTGMPSWGHASALARVMHGNPIARFFAVDGMWLALRGVFIAHAWASALVRTLRSKDHKGALLTPAAWQRLATALPNHPLPPDLKSSTPLAPEGYYGHVASGAISPHRAAVASFSAGGVVLRDGRELAADAVLFAIGSPTPRFPFLPAGMRALLEGAGASGAQLYRHCVHPDIPHVAFAGYNQGVLHIPTVEAAALWTDAYFRGRMATPGREEMKATMQRVAQWKHDHCLPEAATCYSTHTRFQQFLDVVLQDLDLNPYRKPNWFKEVAEGYTADDYDGMVDEYLAHGEDKRFRALDIDM